MVLQEDSWGRLLQATNALRTSWQCTKQDISAGTLRVPQKHLAALSTSFLLAVGSEIVRHSFVLG